MMDAANSRLIYRKAEENLDLRRLKVIFSA